MAAMLGRACRLFIGDYEIQHVRSVTVDAPCDGAVITTVEFISGVSFVNGVFRLEGSPQRGPLTAVEQGETLKVRAISFDAVPLAG